MRARLWTQQTKITSKQVSYIPELLHHAYGLNQHVRQCVIGTVGMCRGQDPRSFSWPPIQEGAPKGQEWLEAKKIELKKKGVYLFSLCVTLSCL